MIGIDDDKTDKINKISDLLELCGEQLEYYITEMENVEKIDYINKDSFKTDYYKYLEERIQVLTTRLMMLKLEYGRFK